MVSIFFNKNNFSCIFYIFNINDFLKISDLSVFLKKYLYFFKRRKTFISNFLYLNLIRNKKGVIYKKNHNIETNLLDYKKKIYSVVLDNRKLYTNVFLNKAKSFKVTRNI